MNRALRAATVGVLLLTPVVLSACSAGQVNQTADQVRDKVGPTERLGDLTLRQVQLAYPTGGSYQVGGDAELQMSIANSGLEDDALVGITGDDFTSVRVTGTGAAPSSPAATATGTASPSATQSAAPTTSEGVRPVDIAIPSHETVFLGQNAPTVTLAGLKRSFTPAQTFKVTFTFRKAGRITMDVGVAAPSQAIPHTATYTFEHGADSASG